MQVEQLQQQPELYIKLEATEGSDLQTEKSSESKNSKGSKSSAPSIRKRAAYTYHQVSNEDRAELLRRVLIGKETLAQASRDLKINYSTAKTIIRTYRKFNRVEKVPHTMRKSKQDSKKSIKIESPKRCANEEEEMEKFSNRHVKQEASFSALPLQMPTQSLMLPAANQSLHLRDAFSAMSKQLAIYEAQKERELILAQQERLRLLSAIQSVNSQNMMTYGYPLANKLITPQYLYGQQIQAQNVFGYSAYRN